MKALILIIGDDPILLRTRAELLRDWQITTVNSRDAGAALRSRPYDLVILSQTVQEAQARSLIAQAQELDPNPRILAIRSGDGSTAWIPNLPGGPEQPGWVAVCGGQDPGLRDNTLCDYIKARAIPSSTTSK